MILLLMPHAAFYSSCLSQKDEVDLALSFAHMTYYFMKDEKPKQT
jgi:hypothetical protein